MKKSLSVSLALLTALLVSPSFAGAEKNQPQRGVKVHVLSPRNGAELPPGADRVTIVVEVVDSSEHGIKLNKGIPVFETPVLKDGKTNQPVKENLGAFLKNLVGVTTYTLSRRPGRPATTVYQLTSVIRTALLGGGCQLPVYPTNLELPASGQTTVFPSGYVEGAELEFNIGNSPMKSEQEDSFPSSLCLVVRPGPAS